MRKTAAICLAGLLLLTAGCSGKSKPAAGPASAAPTSGQPSPAGGGQAQPQPQQGAGPAGPDAAGPDLRSYSSPFSLTVEQLAAGLRREVNLPGDAPPTERLTGLFRQWQTQTQKGELLYAEADMDGDGSQTEVVTALRGAGQELNGHGAVFVIHLKDRTWQVAMGPPGPGAALHAVADLTGDGLPEIVWSTTDVGAHTGNSTVHVSDWSPAAGLQDLPAQMYMASMTLELDGRDILLQGGLINSVGAGDLQRSRTDLYRWLDGAFKLVDRRYAPGQFAYQRLIDGLTAEEFRRTEDALTAYREAADTGRAAFSPGGLPPEWEQKAPDAVRALARARLALLLLKAGRSAEAEQAARAATGAYADLPQGLLPLKDSAAACAHLEDYGSAHPDFLDALNSPQGYANPRWMEADLCGPVPAS
jgi:hypothetical protein